MGKFFLVLIMLAFSGCTVKTLVKNCDKAQSSDYFVCDQVWLK